MKILALDASLSNCGWALSPDHFGVEVGPGRHKGVERLSEWRDWLSGLLELEQPNVVVIEGYSYASAHSQAHSIGELGGVLRVEVARFQLPLVVVPPKTLKKYATGKGNAPKPDLRMELYKRSGLDVADDNAVDALWLLAVGRELVGDPLWDMPKVNREALKKIELPEGVRT